MLQSQAATHLLTLKTGQYVYYILPRLKYKMKIYTLLNMSYLYVLDDVSEDRRALGPRPHQLHGLVEVPDVVGIHPQEGCMLQQNITQAWTLTPGFCGRWQVKDLKSCCP